MSVVTPAARRRWATVLGGALLLGAIPPALAARPTPEPANGISAAVLIERVRRSVDVGHDGLAEVTGHLGLPDLPRLDDTARLLSGTTRARVWWAGPRRWRVATLAPTAERAVATVGESALAFYNSDTATSRYLFGDPAIRLPRTDDLLPPQVARRLLDGVGADDRVERIGPQRIAGRDAAGIRLVPGDIRSSMEAADLWVEPESGLPLALEVRAHGVATPVLASRFLAVELGAPSEELTAPAAPPQARVERSASPDLATRVDREGPWALPDELAGLPRAPAPRTIGGAATYGTGLTRFVLLPLPPDVASDALRRARGVARAVQWPPGVSGEAIGLDRPLISLLVARGPDYAHSYLLAGPVRPEVLVAAARQLFTDPPERRR